MMPALLKVALGMVQMCLCACYSLASRKALLCRDKLQAALLGAFVADAATMPLHWIYSPADISNILQGKDPEFYEKPSSPFYQYPVGELSPYGEEAFIVLKSVVEHGEVQVCSARGHPTLIR
jgi:hypothetical protein